jgi:hypothetical protein
MHDQRQRELEGLLDDLSYQVTAARTAGLHRPDDLRRTLKRMTALLSNIDAVAVTVISERRDL